jgi:hypothetical protein
VVACGSVAGRPDAGPGAGHDAGPDIDAAPPSMDLTVWPNVQSAASSDPWIAAHHDQIRLMRPNVLALNFVNGRTNAEMEALIGQIFAGLKEGSRYHGYTDPGAPAFLDYQLARSVDLTDHPPPSGYQLRNSTRYPRKPAGTADYWHFNYGALFSPQFADYYGFGDPDHPGKNLPLCELLRRGIVHEIWVYGDADTPGDVNAAEVLEWKQRYDGQNHPLAGAFDPCAGNGCFDASDIPDCGVSFRVPWVNHTRGPGCLLHSLGHGFEGMAGHGNSAQASVPALGKTFSHFANFDLRDRLGQPFQTWYDACGDDCVTFTGSNALTWRDNRNMTGTVPQYDQGCGSVHFPPNARANYDDQNGFGVLSTCEHYGLHDGPGGADVAEIYTSAKSGRYDALEGDCEGGWQVYWRQSFPGYQNPARDGSGAAIQNWWVYEFY